MYVGREILFLCEIIQKYGSTNSENQTVIKFGPLFVLYASYSDKVRGKWLFFHSGDHIGSGIVQLCEIINNCGEENEDGQKVVLFGFLFRLYTRISDKVPQIRTFPHKTRVHK